MKRSFVFDRPVENSGDEGYEVSGKDLHRLLQPANNPYQRIADDLELEMGERAAEKGLKPQTIRLKNGVSVTIKATLPRFRKGNSQ